MLSQIVKFIRPLRDKRIKTLASIRSSWDNGVPAKQHTIKHDANGDTYVSDLTIVDVSSSKEVTSLLHQAAQCRSVRKTRMNGQSSRSHFAFTLRISALNEELKGNIRDFCRVRPLLPEDGCASDVPVISYRPATEGHEQGIDLIQTGQKSDFTFDKVLTHQASQNDVFSEISEFEQSALDGYKVCIFAYGQTGSAKTYTMMGRPESLGQKGLIPQSLEQLFQISQKFSAQGWKYQMQAPGLEMYNDCVRDLLASKRSSWDNGVPAKQHTIKHDANRDTYVSDLTIVDVSSSEEVASLLHQAAQCRSVGQIQMNVQSSRSHFAFTLRISALNEGLKGNMCVFCRVRPLLPEDGRASDVPVISYLSATEQHEQGIDLIQTGQKYAFTFDKVLTHQASPTDEFSEISELEQSAFDGYKVCIFAYGQTGSAKTYTMMGRPESLDQNGPRSLEQIFQTSQMLSAQGLKYQMQASVLEIYNESVWDLLASNRSSWDNGVPSKQHTTKHDANGDTYVSDLTIVDVSSSEEVASLLHQAAQCRCVGNIQMNEQSSRSHFVFTLGISAVNETTEKHGVLNFIDLTGSKRLSNSGSTGGQLKKTRTKRKKKKTQTAPAARRPASRRRRPAYRLVQTLPRAYAMRGPVKCLGLNLDKFSLHGSWPTFKARLQSCELFDA